MTLQRRRKVCPFGRIRILTNVNARRMVRSPTERRLTSSAKSDEGASATAAVNAGVCQMLRKTLLV
jgi:hypothetical protein